MWKIRFICIPVELVAYYGTEIGGNVPDDSLYRLVPQSVTPRNSNTFSRKITTGLSLCGRKNYKKTFFQDDYRANVPSYHHLICRISITLRNQKIKIKISISNELFEITVDRIRKPRD